MSPHHQCHKAHTYCFLHIVDKSFFSYCRPLPVKITKNKYIGSEGKTFIFKKKKRHFWCTGIYISTHSYSNKLTHKDRATGRVVYPSQPKARMKGPKKHGSTQGHCPQSQVIDKKVQGKLISHT